MHTRKGSGGSRFFVIWRVQHDTALGGPRRITTDRGVFYILLFDVTYGGHI